ncbi:MAG: hypothetical protein U5K51_11505 [Flavobacteriaceae bacterium]|nr:hypothetical protein [Flavobacteriaceae bacterium]
MTNSAKNKLIDKSFYYWGIFSTSIGLILLAIFIGYIMYIGLGRINGDFFTSFPSRFPEKAGIFTALLGSVWILVLTLLFAFPIGVAAAIYLEEYQTKGKFSTLLEINISNLAGIPSIILRAFGIASICTFFWFWR